MRMLQKTMHLSGLLHVKSCTFGAESLNDNNNRYT